MVTFGAKIYSSVLDLNILLSLVDSVPCKTKNIHPEKDVYKNTHRRSYTMEKSWKQLCQGADKRTSVCSESEPLLRKRRRKPQQGSQRRKPDAGWDLSIGSYLSLCRLTEGKQSEQRVLWPERGQTWWATARERHGEHSGVTRMAHNWLVCRLNLSNWTLAICVIHCLQLTACPPHWSPAL